MPNLNLNDVVKYVEENIKTFHDKRIESLDKLKSDFTKATKALRTSNSQINVRAVNGCCYGRDNKPDKGDYLKLCGQRFWEFISKNSELYTQIIEPVGSLAKERNDDFTNSCSNMINKFTAEFTRDFCDTNGSIKWEKLVEFNSAK